MFGQYNQEFLTKCQSNDDRWRKIQNQKCITAHDNSCERNQ